MEMEQFYVVEYKNPDYEVELFKNFNDASTRFNELAVDFSHGEVSGVFLRDANVVFFGKYGDFEILDPYETLYGLGKEVI